MSSDVSEKETIEKIIPIIENQLSVSKTSVKITPIEQLIGVNKTYRSNMETISDTSVSNESIIIKYNPTKPSHNARARVRRGGKGKAIVAVAHKMIRIVYFMLMRDEPYRGQNVELTGRKLKRMEGRASIGLRI